MYSIEHTFVSLVPTRKLRRALRYPREPPAQRAAKTSAISRQLESSPSLDWHKLAAVYNF
jgi:hypothetical protein